MTHFQRNVTEPLGMNQHIYLREMRVDEAFLHAQNRIAHTI